MTDTRVFFFADDVAQMLGVGKSSAYGIIKRLNDELEKSGFLTVSGRIPKKYFFERFYAGEQAFKAGTGDISENSPLAASEAAREAGR